MLITASTMNKKKLLIFVLTCFQCLILCEHFVFPSSATPFTSYFDPSIKSISSQENLFKLDSPKEELYPNEWELINSVTPTKEKLLVQKYRSKRTNLTVILSPAETPIVNGYFCLATEAFDDDGLPHTLEHMIFRGSEDYPYKQTLDSLANR